MSRRSRARAGFTLIEALVSIVILVIVMALTMSLLFGMRAFAERQQTYTAPRQTARGAIDYLTHYVQGAGDLNTLLNNPNALVMYFNSDAGPGGVPRQASFNNVTDANLADLGTDILTVAIPSRPIVAPVHNWPGYKHAATMDVEFRAGCPNEAYNLYLFEQATNATPLSNPVSNQAQSGLLMLVDSDTGMWTYFQITSYQPNTDCNDPNGNIIHIVANPGQSGMIDPPGGHPGMNNPKIMCGVEFRSFRIRNGSLEQKNGMFDPSTDNPGTAFFPIVENVEDLQVAYIYGKGPHTGEVWNTGYDPGSGWTAHTLTTPNAIPTQAGPNTLTPDEWDVTNVVGLRFSLTGRSLPLPLSSLKLTERKGTSADPSVAHHFRPASEDHTQGALDVNAAKPVVYDHTRLTTTLMLRNRILGG